MLFPGDGTESVLGALRFATQLNFRAGASKTFILLPCSSCDTVQVYTVVKNVFKNTEISHLYFVLINRKTLEF